LGRCLRCFRIAPDSGPIADVARRPFGAGRRHPPKFPCFPARLHINDFSANNAAPTLRAGAGKVDAIEIDPVIVMVGQQSHPEKPYGDPLARARVNPSYFGAPLA